MLDSFVRSALENKEKYFFTSETSQGTVHTMTLELNTQDAYCTCKGYFYKKKCRHITEVKARGNSDEGIKGSNKSKTDREPAKIRAARGD